MKNMKKISVLIFCVLLMIPLALFNWKEDCISKIDNRNLAKNPFGQAFQEEHAGEYIDKTQAIEDYIQDRLGLRDKFITLYTEANDKLFNKMEHPSYMYGKDGYVFFKFHKLEEFTEYHIIYADMIKNIQDYCVARNVPFLFVFDPEKTSMYQHLVQDGVNYNNDWVKEFLAELDKRHIHYVDNSATLQPLIEQGEPVFNVKYNAGHWNDLGAFYGVNAIVESLQNQGINAHINQKSEYTVEDKLNTTLPVSEFKIHEYEPIFTLKEPVEDLYNEYGNEIKRSEQYRTFMHTKKNIPTLDPVKALVFQGSYMNGMGYKFLENTFDEYIAIHDYQNICDFEYYFNIFQPDCVVFETAEYTLNDAYYNRDLMKKMRLNPVLTTFNDLDKQYKTLNELQYDIEENNNLVTITLQNPNTDTQYGYLVHNGINYDFEMSDDQQSLIITVPKEVLQSDYKIILITHVEQIYQK